MKERMLAILLSAVLVMAMLPAMALAAGDGVQTVLDISLGNIGVAGSNDFALRSVDAKLSAVTVSGVKGTAITSTSVTISLYDRHFKALPDDTDVSDWFTNIPDGLTATIHSAVAENDTTITFAFSGTPTAQSKAAMTVVIPAVCLMENEDVSVPENANAKWDIGVVTVFSVEVSAESLSVKKGGSQQFIAGVAGEYDPAQTVTWSVTGNNSASTTISASGVLKVAADETAAPLTVKATSTVDTTKSGTVTVTVITSPDSIPTPRPERFSDSFPDRDIPEEPILDLTPVTISNDSWQTNATVWITGSGLDSSDLLITDRNPSGSAYQSLLKLAGESDVVSTYNIYLRSGKKSTSSAVNLTFDLNAEYAGDDFTLVHQRADATYEYFYDAADANGDVTFGPLYELSPFMLVKGRLVPSPLAEIDENPDTGVGVQPSLGYVAACTMVAALLAIRKNRKQQKAGSVR